MDIIATIQLQVNRELAALRRSGISDYAVRSEAIRNFEARLKQHFTQHPDEAYGCFGYELELPPAKFNAIMQKCADALTYDDDSRFTLYDLMDAVGHAPFDLDIKKLLKLSNEDAYNVLMALADAKRRTYCSDFEHAPDAYPVADDLDGLIEKHGLLRQPKGGTK